jgi:hypothetical protein
VTFYIEGFSHFVSSMAASIASGWNKSCRGDFHHLENAALALRTPTAAGRGSQSPTQSGTTDFSISDIQRID